MGIREVAAQGRRALAQQISVVKDFPTAGIAGPLLVDRALVRRFAHAVRTAIGSDRGAIIPSDRAA